MRCSTPSASGARTSTTVAVAEASSTSRTVGGADSAVARRA
jgi:hypothetical protein